MNQAQQTDVRSVPWNCVDVLQRAIDPVRILDLLTVHWDARAAVGGGLRGCAVHRVFPRGRDRYVVKYVLEVEDEQGRRRSRIAFGEVAPGDAEARRQRLVQKLRKSRRGQLRKDGRGDAVVAAIPELGMVFFPAGYDEKLPGLVLHHRPLRARELLDRFVGGEGGRAPQVSSRILNHRPGKRCILRLSDEAAGTTRSMVVRCLRPGDGRVAWNLKALQTLQAAGLDAANRHRVRVPRALGGDETLAVAVLEDVPAANLQEAVQWDALHKARVAATALAAFHGLELSPARSYAPEEELAMLEGWVGLTARLRPELEQDLLRAWHGVRARLVSLPPVPAALTHRDFYAKQVLYDGEQIVLLDFDTLCLSDPALDLGNHLAHQRLDTAPAAWEAEDEAFLGAYEALRPLPPLERVAVWRDAALLRLACLYALRTGWEPVAGRLLSAIQD